MDEQKLKNTYIPHIRTQIRVGNIILFTGAGFSLGAKNILGEHPPLANDLKKIYWELCYGEEEFDDESSLMDIFDSCLRKNPKSLRERTLQALTLQRGSLEEWYNLYFMIPWLSAYTLNIDNLETIATDQFKLKRKLRGISAASSFSSSLQLTSSHYLQFIHLNGDLDDVPDKVTFSTIQYAERATDSDPWSLRLSTDLQSNCVIFVGTDLDEPPLWHFMALRGSRGSRLGEFRPRSYLVSPSLSKPRSDLLSQFNIVHIPMTSEEFATSVLSEVTPNDIQEGIAVLESIHATGRSSSKPMSLGNANIDPNQKTEFLMGQDPSWSDITSGRAIEREFDQTIESEVRNQLSNTKRTPILITGPAGTGKTSSLMRIALKLHAEGKHVFWIDRNSEIGPGKIVDFVLSGEEIDIIAIDDGDIYGTQLSNLLRNITENDKLPLILIEMRSHFIDRCLVPALLKGLKPIELVIPKITDLDIEQLIQTLDRENRLGTLKGLPRLTQIKAFRDKADRELVVAMYEATTGLKFRDRIVDELTQLDEPAKLIYALVAVASSRRFNLSRDEIVIAIGDPSNQITNEIERLTRRRLLVHPRNDEALYSCRHRIIGDFVKDAIHQQGLMYPILSGLLRMAALRTNSRMSASAKPKRMLRVFINHDFVYEMLDFSQARDLYADLEPILEFNHHFWLHRGSIEVEYGSIEHAENFLAQALGLASNDPLVKNEWAYLLFKKACLVPSSLDAPKWAEEAESILIELIYEEKSHPHPYHVLGSQGLMWSRSGIREPSDRADYLKRLEKHVRKGIEEFPSNVQIREIAQKVQQEYLSLAVK